MHFTTDRDNISFLAIALGFILSLNKGCYSATARNSSVTEYESVATLVKYFHLVDDGLAIVKNTFLQCCKLSFCMHHFGNYNDALFQHLREFHF